MSTDPTATLLLVDGRSLIRAGLRMLLDSRPGIRVIAEADDVPSALARLREATPDVVLANIDAIAMDGVEAVRRVRARAPQARVLALVTEPRRNTVVEALAAGALGLALTSTPLEELVEGIRVVSRGQVFISEGLKALLSDAPPTVAPNEPEAVPAPQPILTTKLYRPRTSPRLLARPHLIRRMDRALELPLTLVSAPAGYGKTTLASQWLDARGHRVAWLSVTKEDEDLQTFLNYMVLAVQTQFPTVGSRTLSLVRSLKSPDTHLLARQLANDLDGLEEPLVLVLDDLQQVRSPEAMEVLAGMLEHPPRNLHILVLSRWDPALPLGRLRARGMMAELRMDELRFTVDEAHAYLERTLERPVSPSVAEVLHHRTEGWVTGLRLATMATRADDDLERFVAERSRSRATMEYFFDEVLAGLPPDRRMQLLATSVLNRFCAELCGAAWAGGKAARSGGEASELTAQAQEFIEWGLRKDLFVVPLDWEGRWFRFHHLFQAILGAELRDSWSEEAIRGLHRGAGEWLGREGHVDEALDHALAAGDQDMAARIVGNSRLSSLRKGEWPLLERRLDKLPAETVRAHPDLVLGRAWTLNYRMRPEQVLELIGPVRTLADEGRLETDLLGELLLFEAFPEYWGGDDPEAARQALSDVPETSDVVRRQKQNFLALARQACGEGPAMIEALEAEIAALAGMEPFTRCSLLQTLAQVTTVEGDLPGALRAASALSNLGSELGDVHMEAWGYYLQGASSLRWGKLEAACRFLGEASTYRHMFNLRAAVDSLAALAVGHQMAGRPNESRDDLRLAADFAKRTRDPWAARVAASAEARVALLRGDLDLASDWEERSDDTPPMLLEAHWIESPFLTRCRVLVARGSDGDLREALRRLRSLSDWQQRLHNRCHMAETAVLEAVALQGLGEVAEAERALERAMTVVTPEWRLPFLEVGRPIADLLRMRMGRHAGPDHGWELISAIEAIDRTELPSRRDVGPIAPTLREIEILTLVAKGNSNKAIAREMSLSVETVKKHLYNLFKKLDAPNRTAAVASARGMGVLPPDDARAPSFPSPRPGDPEPSRNP